MSISWTMTPSGGYRAAKLELIAHSLFCFVVCLFAGIYVRTVDGFFKCGRDPGIHGGVNKRCLT